VEGVAELVEERGGVVVGEEGGQAGRGLVEVEVVDDDGGDVAREALLVAEGVHPGAAALGGAGVVVAIEDADVGAVAIEGLPGADVGMVDGEAGAFDESEAEELVGDPEGRFDHVVEREVGLELLFVEVVFGEADLFGVVAPVPGFEGRGVDAFGCEGGGEFGGFALGGGEGGLPELVEQGAGGGGGFRHGIGEGVGGVVGVAEELGAFAAELDDFGDQGFVVVLVVVVAAGGPGFKGGAAQVAAGAELEEGFDAAALEGDDPMAVALGGGAEGGRDVGFGVEDEFVGGGIGEEVLFELGGEGGEGLVDGGEAGLGFRGKLGAGADEVFVGLGEEAAGFGGEGRGWGMDGVDTGEEGGVEGDGAAMVGHEGGDFAGDGLEFGVGVGGVEVGEEVADAGEEGAGAFEGFDGVGEGGWFGVGGDGLDFGEVEADAFVEGGEEVGWFDEIERGDGVGGGPGGEEGVRVH
jgi:hypothetical protein